MSKDERDRMVDAGPPDRWNGWNLTQEGVEAAVAGGMAARHGTTSVGRKASRR